MGLNHKKVSLHNIFVSHTESSPSSLAHPVSDTLFWFFLWLVLIQPNYLCVQYCTHVSSLSSCLPLVLALRLTLSRSDYITSRNTGESDREIRRVRLVSTWQNFLLIMCSGRNSKDSTIKYTLRHQSTFTFCLEENLNKTHSEKHRFGSVILNNGNLLPTSQSSWPWRIMNASLYMSYSTPVDKLGWLQVRSSKSARLKRGS